MKIDLQRMYLTKKNLETDEEIVSKIRFIEYFGKISFVME